MRFKPEIRNPYLRLMRLHQPVGFWLCYWPAAWAIVLADTVQFHGMLLWLFFLGAVSVRGAGCVINDLVDRDFDRQVERTRTRPLASGELNVRQALMLLAGLLVFALCTLISVYHNLQVEVSFAALLGVTAPVLGLIVGYPFMKRITWWPQAFLGITFNWGVLIGWVAVRGELEWPAFVLYAAAVLWTLGYDTIYGFQDLRDDKKVGIKSTSRLMERHAKLWVGAFYAGVVALLFVLCQRIGGDLRAGFTLGILVLALHFHWQVRQIDTNWPERCRDLFKSNAWIGGFWLLPAALLEFL